MYCKYCGGELPDKAVFCPTCGKRQERPRGAGERPSASAGQVTDAQPASPAKTQAMPVPGKAAYVPAAVPGYGPVAGAGQARPAGGYRTAPASSGASASKPRVGVVAAVVLAAFVVLAGGVFAFAHFGSSPASTSTSDTTAAQAQTQSQAQDTSSTTTSKTDAQADSDTAKQDESASKEVELDGLSTMGDSIVYVNPTFGYALKLPSSFKAVAASDSGEGASFEDASSGIRVDVSAEANTTGATVESVLAEYTGAYGVSYQATGKTWMVASWEDGAGDYYAKQYVGENYITRIQYSTPTASHETGSQLIEDTINDFQPGAL